MLTQGAAFRQESPYHGRKGVAGPGRTHPGSSAYEPEHGVQNWLRGPALRVCGAVQAVLSEAQVLGWTAWEVGEEF